MAKYLRGLGTGAWNTDASWSTTSSAGPANTTKPVAGDAVILDGGSAATCTVDVQDQACASIVCTGYVGTLLMTTHNLTTTSTVTLVAGMTFTPGTATWNMGFGGNPTITHASKSFYNLNFTATGTGTIAGATLAVTNTLSVATGITATLATNGINTKNIHMVGTGIITGQTVTMNTDQGVWDGTSTGILKSSLTFAPGVGKTVFVSGGVGKTVFVSGTVYYSTGTISQTNGTVDTTTTPATLVIMGSFTSNASGITWNTIQHGNATTSNATLTSALYCTNFIHNSTGAFNIATSDLFIAGNLTFNSTGDLATSSSEVARIVTMTGNGTWSSPGGGALQTNLTINAPGCTVAISGNVYYGMNTAVTNNRKILYIAGTISAAGSTLNVGFVNFTLTDATNTWGNIKIKSNVGTTVNMTLSQVTTLSGSLYTDTGMTLTISTNNLTCVGLTTVGSVIGSQTLTCNGGTWSGSGGYVQCPMTVTGSVTLSNRPAFGGFAGTLDATAATLIPDGTDTLTLYAPNVALIAKLPTNQSLTNLTLSGYGASGSITFDASKTITVTNRLRMTSTITGTGLQTFAVKSGTPGTPTAIKQTSMTVFPEVLGVVATDIDSSGGMQILDQGGTLVSGNTNWVTTWAAYGRSTAFVWAG